MENLPPIDQCEILFIPGRKAPIIVWPDPGQTRIEMIQTVMRRFNTAHAKLGYVHGERKQSIYDAYVQAHADGHVVLHPTLDNLR